VTCVDPPGCSVYPRAVAARAPKRARQVSGPDARQARVAGGAV